MKNTTFFYILAVQGSIWHNKAIATLIICYALTSRSKFYMYQWRHWGREVVAWWLRRNSPSRVSWMTMNTLQLPPADTNRQPTTVFLPHRAVISATWRPPRIRHRGWPSRSQLRTFQKPRTQSRSNHSTRQTS